MTAGQVLDYARSLLGPAGATIPTAHLLSLLSMAQEEVSREAKLPRTTVQYDNLTADNQMVLPDDARREGLIAAYQVEKNADGAVVSSRVLPIYDFTTASRLSPHWTTWTPTTAGASFLLYDPAHNPDVPRPVPGPSVEHERSFRITYVKRPAPLDGLDSAIFDGKFSGLTPVLAYRVAWLLTKDAVYRHEYERSMAALAGQARPPLVIAYNPTFWAGAPGGSR